MRCDLLSFYYLCRTGNNFTSLIGFPFSVVICFHFTIFVVLETTMKRFARYWIMLWFAFILLSLSYWKQPQDEVCAVGAVVICFHFTIFVVLETTVFNDFINEIRCDLLSFYYLCRTGNNRSHTTWKSGRVVICFHFTIFVVLETTALNVAIISFALWFAFILLSLSYWKQPWSSEVGRVVGCDLLSFYYLCRTGNNPATITLSSQSVVICFHFTIFVVLETTRGKYRLKSFCCDLLSFYYLCRTGNNMTSTGYTTRYVVICFHFTIFVVLETTFRVWCHAGHGVVICFHFTIFVVLETTELRRWLWRYSCDLLSFYYLCRTGNNKPLPLPPCSVVVICFHFTIFVVLETTVQQVQGRERVVICFHFTIFVVLETTVEIGMSTPSSCDLLSFYYLCRTGNNVPLPVALELIVVICFHFTIFVVLETTVIYVFLLSN